MSSPTNHMRKLTIAKAMAEAIRQEMATDPSVIVIGEDIAKLGGVFGTTTGLLELYGSDRVRDTPISETGFIGAAVGLSASGFKPIVELMFVDFFGVCMDPIYNLAAKQSYFSGGQLSCPMVIMTSVGGGYGDAGQHSQCLYATFGHLPGLKVVIPSNAHDAKGLMLAAIRDPNPVVFMYHKALQGMGWLGTVKRSIVDVPEGDFVSQIGKAKVVREGSDLTIVSLAVGVHHALDVAEELAKSGVEVEVVDIVTIAPLDREGIRASVAKTGRLLVIDDDYLSYGIGAEIIASVCEGGIQLKAPPRRIAYPDIPVPFTPVMEHFVLPNAEKALRDARELMECE